MSSLFRIILLAGLLLSSPLCIDCPLQAQQSQQELISALCDSGFVFLDREDHEAARLVFREALDIDRNHPEALLGMGRAMIGLGRNSRAVEFLNKAIEQSPDDLSAHYHKAVAHYQAAMVEITGRSHANRSQEAIAYLLSINPSHPEAYYLRGRVLRDIFQEYEAAIQAFSAQIMINPDHTDAIIDHIKILIDVGQWDEAIGSAESSLSHNPDLWQILPFLAAAYWKCEEYDESMRTFERFFATAPAEERDLYFNLGCVITPDEQSEFAALGPQGQRNYWMNYWRSRDPNPKTEVNERLLEHFIRIAYARVEFGQAIWPWDARGRFYVRYGEAGIKIGPNRPYPVQLIDDFEYFNRKLDLYFELGLSTEMMKYFPEWLEKRYPSTGFTPELDGGGTPAVWLWVERGIDIKFDNPVMNGQYLIDEDLDYAPMVEAMERRMPSISEEEEKIETFDPFQLAVSFRGKGNTTELEYVIGILADDFGPFRSATGEYAFIDVKVDLFSPAWEHTGSTTIGIQRYLTIPHVTVRGNQMFIHNTRLEVDPGEYTVSILVLDPETGIRATAEERITLPDYSGDDLMISDILPAARIAEVGQGRSGQFIRGNLEVIPLPGRTLGRDQPLFIYFEIYNLVRDRFGSTRYSIEYAVSESTSDDGALKRLFQGLGAMVGIRGRRSVLSSEFSRTGVQNDERSHLEVDLSALPHGIYDLMVTITDQVSGQVVSKILTVRTLPPVPEKSTLELNPQ